MKLRQSLSYLGMDPEPNHKRKTHYQRRLTYNQHRSTVRSLIEAGFIPYSGADADTFFDMDDCKPDIFAPDIINEVDDVLILKEE